MIPKHHRGISKQEIDILFKKGTRARIPGGFLCYQGGAHGRTRIAVSVSKRAAQGAVQRNRARRKIRAAAQPLLSKTAPERDYLIVWTGEEAPDMTRLTKELQTLAQE